MFLRKAALRPVPPYAIVDHHAITSLENDLEGMNDQLQETLDTAYRDLDRRQPTLGAWLAEQVSGRTDEMAQSLGYFLGVTVYLAFREAFPTRLRDVDDAGLRLALDTLEADEELRAGDPTEVLDSDDIVAMGQPALIEFIQHHLNEAIEQGGEEVDLEDLQSVYRAILVEVIALSHAVASPSGHFGPPREGLA